MLFSTSTLLDDPVEAVGDARPEVPDAADAAVGEAFDGVLGAFRQEGFDAGYRRAVNDLLAEFLLISEEYLHEQPNPAPGLRETLRSFSRHLERFAEIRRELGNFVDGGLGI
jgi:hypothetical protein